MKKILASLLMALNANLVAEAQNYLTDVVQKPYDKLYRAGDHSLHSIRGKRKAIFFDDKAIDSTFAQLSKAFMKYDKWICYEVRNDKYNMQHDYSKDNNKYFIMVVDTNGKTSITTNPNSSTMDQTLYSYTNSYRTDKFSNDSIEEMFERGMVTKQFYSSKKQNPYNKRLYQLNPFSGQEDKLLFDLDKLYKDSIGHTLDLDRIRNLYELDDSRLFFSTAYCELGGCEGINYFIYDNKNTSIKWVRNVFRRESDGEVNDLLLYCTDRNQQYHLGEYGEYGVNNVDHKGFFVFDNNIKVVSRALSRHSRNVGLNYIKGKIDSYNIKSNLDNGTEVIVAFKLILPLERSMLKVFSDQEVTKQDLVDLDRYGLAILKNLVHAKHNVKFTENFYQAYFNFFDFYRDEKKRISRLTNVNHLLTTSDKRNLQAIEVALNKLKIH